MIYLRKTYLVLKQWQCSSSCYRGGKKPLPKWCGLWNCGHTKSAGIRSDFHLWSSVLPSLG